MAEKLSRMTHAEFLFWERAMVASLCDGDVAPTDAANCADKAVVLRRERAAMVVDYYGEALYLKDGKPSLTRDTSWSRDELERGERSPKPEGA